MAKIYPFKAIRPTRDKVQLVTSQPFYAYSKTVLEAILSANPYSFLHIINPEFGPGNNPELKRERRFKLIHEGYEKFQEKGIFLKEKESTLYLYRQIKDGHEFLGIIAGASIDEYDNDEIKRHEKTLTDREEMFAEYLHIVGYNAEPVLLSYSDEKNEIDNILIEKTKERPEYEFSTMDEIKHELWVFTQDEVKLLQDKFEKIKPVYIVDGHHRSASSSALRGYREKIGAKHFVNEDYFMALFINEKRLKIFEFNRLMKHLNGKSEQEVIDELKSRFDVMPLQKGAIPTQKHEFTMCLKGNWFKLGCKKGIFDENHPVKSLDTDILTENVLKPVFGVKDLKKDKNIGFVEGGKSVEYFENIMTEKNFEVGFMLYPIEINEIKSVADNHLTMPPKSTWVEPKLRSGLTIYNINE